MCIVSATARTHSIWRYPVKSMAGEKLKEARVTTRGILGDRAYALVDERNRVGTARKLRGILDCHTRFLNPPQSDESDPPMVIITLPDGRTVSSEQADGNKVLSDFFAHKVALYSPV